MAWTPSGHMLYWGIRQICQIHPATASEESSLSSLTLGECGSHTSTHRGFTSLAWPSTPSITTTTSMLFPPSALLSPYRHVTPSVVLCRQLCDHHRHYW